MGGRVPGEYIEGGEATGMNELKEIYANVFGEMSYELECGCRVKAYKDKQAKLDLCDVHAHLWEDAAISLMKTAMGFPWNA